MRKIGLVLFVAAFSVNIYAQQVIINGKYQGKTIKLTYVKGIPDIISFFDYEGLDELKNDVSQLQQDKILLQSLNNSLEKKIKILESQNEKLKNYRNDEVTVKEEGAESIKELITPVSIKIDTLKNQQDNILLVLENMGKKIDSLKKSSSTHEIKGKKNNKSVEPVDNSADNNIIDTECRSSITRINDEVAKIDSLKTERKNNNLDSDEQFEQICNYVENIQKYVSSDCKKNQEYANAIATFKSTVDLYKVATNYDRKKNK